MAEGEYQAGFAKRCLIVLAFVALAATIYALASLLLMIFGAIVVAVILRAIARLYLRFGLPEGLSVGLAVLSLFALIGALGWIFGGLVAGQFSALVQQIPAAIANLQLQLHSWGIDYDVAQASRDIGSQLSGLTTRAGDFAASAGGAVTNIILVLAGAVFFAAQPKLYTDAILRLVPKDREEIARIATEDSARALGLWLQAQILSSIVVFIMTYIGLKLLGVPSAAALALIAAALDFIPFIGPVVAGIPAILVAFTASPATALWTVGLYLLIQQIQGNILQPLIQKRSVDLSPAVLLFAVVAAGTLFGIVGVILSAPLTVVAFVLVQRLYIEQVLGKPAKTPGPADDLAEDGETEA